MEIHSGARPNPEAFSFSVSLDEFYQRAMTYSERYMRDGLEHYRSLRVENVTHITFWHDYVWCVYTSGFNAKVVSRKISDILDVYGGYELATKARWSEISKLIANRNKFNAIQNTAARIQQMGWRLFRKTYLMDVNTIPLGCEHIGPITKYHLARNIGMDVVKPDKHLVRLAENYNYQSCEAMCRYLSDKYFERIGVVDFVLWSYCCAYSTKGLTRL